MDGCGDGQLHVLGDKGHIHSIARLFFSCKQCGGGPDAQMIKVESQPAAHRVVNAVLILVPLTGQKAAVMALIEHHRLTPFLARLCLFSNLRPSSRVLSTLLIQCEIGCRGLLLLGTQLGMELPSYALRAELSTFHTSSSSRAGCCECGANCVIQRCTRCHAT